VKDDCNGNESGVKGDASVDLFREDMTRARGPSFSKVRNSTWDIGLFTVAQSPFSGYFFKPGSTYGRLRPETSSYTSRT
jgi:hypothetical protein